MPEEPYDMIPHNEIMNLKKQLKELKSKQEKLPSKGLLNSMSTLNKSINTLIKLFSDAAEELKHDEEPCNLKPINEKLEQISRDNKIIAEGLVTISDRIKELNEQKPAPERYPEPKPETGFQINEQNFPPVPDNPFPGIEPKKRGIFGRLKR